MSIDVNISRINNFEYSFKLSSRNGIRHVAKALTFRNPDPYAYSQKIEKFDKRRLTFKIGMLPTLEKYIKVHKLSYQINDYDFNIPEGDALVNLRSDKAEKLGINGVHPATSGYYQIGDVVFRNFVANLCQ